MPPTLRLGAVDLSNYLRVAPGEGMDPYDGDGFLEPAFTTAPLGEGEPRININAKNREMAFPLFVKADPAATAVTNLVTNPSFEVDTSGWGPGAGTVLTRVARGTIDDEPRNLLLNPSFETGTTSWTVTAGKTLTRTSPTFATGAYAAHVTGTAAASGYDEALLSCGYYVAGDRVVVADGQQYTFSADVVMVSGPPNSGSITIFWHDSAGGLISSSTTSIPIDGNLARRSVTGTAPAGAVKVSLWIGTTIGSAGGQAIDFTVDACLFVAGTGTTFFDGDVAGYQWTGTRGASISAANSTYTPTNGNYGARISNRYAGGGYNDCALYGSANFPVTPGLKYSASCEIDVRAAMPLSALQNSLFIRWLDAGFAYISDSITGGALALGRQRIKNEGKTAPSNAAWAQILVVVTARNPQSFFADAFVDSVMFVQGATLPTYGDGDSAGWVWNGTRHASTSSTVVGKDGLHRLIRTINSEIVNPTTRPLRIEWRDDGANSSTFYDVAYARLDPAYSYRHSQKGYAAGVLRAWAQPPYGHTATERAFSSAVASMLPVAIATLPVGSLAGDAPALSILTVGAGSYRPNEGRLLAVAALPASYVPWIPAASFAGAPALTGDARAPASQAAFRNLSANLANAVQFDLPAPSAYAGANRLIGVVRALTFPQTFLRAFAPGGVPLGPTAVASGGVAPGYQAVDLGVLNVPTQWVAPSQYRVDIRAAMPSQTGAFSDHTGSMVHQVALAGVVIVPEERSAFVLDQPGRTLAVDSFRYDAPSAVASGTGDEVGNLWNDAISDQQQWIVSGTSGLLGGGAFVRGNNDGPGGLRSAATAVDMRISALVGFQTLDVGASGRAWVDLRRETASQFAGGGALNGVRAHLQGATPAHLSLLAINAGVTQLIASTILPTAAMYAFGAAVHGYMHSLRLHVQGAEVWADVAIMDDKSSRLANLASVGVASWGGAVGSAGFPGFTIRNATSINESAVVAHFRADDPRPSHMLERDLYTLDQANAIAWRKQGASAAAGDLVARLEGGLRGRQPQITTADRALAFVSLPRMTGAGNDLLDVTVRVRERFTYAA